MKKRGDRVPFFVAMKDRQTITELVENQIAGTEIFLVEARVTPGKITVLIDKPAGITIQECIGLNRSLTGLLEPEGILETHELEVSSPGMDQPLKVLPQYLRRIGRDVRVITKDGQQHEGKLVSAGNEGIEIIKTTVTKVNKKKETTEEQLKFAFETIKETKLILTFKN